MPPQFSSWDLPPTPRQALTIARLAIALGIRDMIYEMRLRAKTK